MVDIKKIQDTFQSSDLSEKSRREELAVALADMTIIAARVANLAPGGAIDLSEEIGRRLGIPVDGGEGTTFADGVAAAAAIVEARSLRAYTNDRELAARGEAIEALAEIRDLVSRKCEACGLRVKVKNGHIEPHHLADGGLCGLSGFSENYDGIMVGCDGCFCTLSCDDVTSWKTPRAALEAMDKSGWKGNLSHSLCPDCLSKGAVKP